MKFLSCASLLIFSASLMAAEPATTFRIADGPAKRVEILAGGRVMLQSPEEGLWSVATGWKDGWPSDWRQAAPEKVEQAGDWTVLTGHLDLPQGRLNLEDAYRTEGQVVRGLRRFTWTGKVPLPGSTLSVRWTIPNALQAKPMLPGIVHYGNPCGASTNANAVAVHAGKPGDESIFEEHRYAVPMAVAEWRDGEAWRSAALHTVPSLVPDGRHADQWWSLGIAAKEQATELLLLSGPCTANGKRSVTKSLQGKFMDFPDNWVDLRPGTVVEKSFYLEACPAVAQGSGFRTPLRTDWALRQPFSLDGLPSYDRIIHDKYRFACSRFRDREKDPGFEMYPDFIKGTHYVMGWCGQAEALGFALPVLAKRLGDPKAAEMGRRSLDFLATAPFNQNGFLLNYTAENGKWDGQDWVSQGQAMESFARAIQAARHRGDDAKACEAFLAKACDLQAARILAPGWHPKSTAEGFLVSPLCKGYALFGKEEYRQAALKAAEHYAARHLAMAEPYWGGTLDASCEDKEGAVAGFQAFLAVYEMTRDPKHLEWAAHALDTMLTWTVDWDIQMPAGRLADHNFKTRGWTVVSAQNQHLDVFGVLVTPEVWRMGDYLKRDDLKQVAAAMFRSCGQIIDPRGSQGEQIQHTNFAQRGNMTDVFRMRGGYSEDWTVFWITAHFLNAAAEFETMGVDLDRPLAPTP